MEFHEKVQELRKQKGLTQEQLAEKLYVSRAAVSKWESGRGYPSIDSLKAIASFYSLTIDDLLSGEELLTIAEDSQTQSTQRIRNLVFGLLDLGTALLLFLPIFGQQEDNLVRAVSLLALTGVSRYLKIAYCFFVAALTLWGILTLVFQNRMPNSTVSLLLHILATLLFILSSQPYGAALLFLFLGIKVLILTKKQ